MRFGGCRCDLPASWLEQTKQVVERLFSISRRVRGVTQSQRNSHVAHSRGRRPARDLAVNASITGPMLRASGVNYDIRKVDKYGIYDRLSFRVR